MTLVPATLTLALPETVFEDFWATRKYFGVGDFFRVAGTFLAFATGAIIANSFLGLSRSSQDSFSWRPTTRTLSRVFRLGFWLTTAGYVIWFAVAASRGLGFATIQEIARDPSKVAGLKWLYFFPTLPGVTTLTQFGAATVILGTIVGIERGWRFVRTPLVVVFLLSLVASFLISARLMLLELALPMAVLYLRSRVELEGRVRRRALGVSILLGLLLVILVFGVFEYSRSWLNVYFGASRIVNYGFVAYAALLLCGYYTTALNNGALLVHHVGTLPVPFFLVDWFWHFPLLRSALPYSAVSGFDVEATYSQLLQDLANPGFNNPSGVMLPYVDLGVVGAVGFWLCAGFAAGALYRAFRRGRLSGLLLYPYFFIGVLEAPRTPYWTAGRQFPSWVLLLLALFIIELERLGKRRGLLAGAAEPRLG